MNPWVWVVAAYACAALVLGGYALWVRRRLREAEASQEVKG